jgi:UDP-glucose 4-epimerase
MGSAPYLRERRLPTVVVRLFNTVGPRQTGAYGMVIPRFVHQAIRDEPVTVYGDGTQTRSFCHVSDVVEALVDLMEHPEARGRVFNVGATEETSINDLAHRVITLSDSRSKVRYVPYDEAYEEGFEDMPRRVPDITRALARWEAVGPHVWQVGDAAVALLGLGSARPRP